MYKPQHMSLHKKEVVLITGPTSGIGHALANIFAQEGHDLVLVGRDERKLQALRSDIEEKFKVSVRTIVQDLSRPTAAVHVHDICKKRDIHIDILVNNAGFGLYGEFIKTDVLAERDLVQVNVVAVSELAKLFAKDMAQRKRGRILNVASIAGFFPGPFMATYYASKAYVLSLSEALCEELRGTGVTVSILCPGLTNTNFGATTHMNDPESFLKGMDASEVGMHAYLGVMKGKRIIVPGFKNKLFVFLPRFLPRYLVTRILARAMK